MTNNTRIRPPAVAGLFYPAAAKALRAQVEELLAAVTPSVGARPRAIVVPHAGYIYSGAAAARAYARLAPWREQIKRVVICGPPHRVPFRGLALSSAAAFATPLGELMLDAQTVSAWSGERDVAINDVAHAPEHSIEVQLPFLEIALGDISILPVLVADTAPARLAELLAPHWDRDDTLIVISTDLSHFLDYDTARRRDGETDDSIMKLDATRIGPDQACGCRPLNGLLHLGAQRAAHIERLALCNSGDTAGSRDRVVGYGSYVLH
jgi:hypothetical protein